MAKPRIFLSSTCYDLTDSRDHLTNFLESLGFDVLNSQRSNFGVAPGLHSVDACLRQVETSDFFVLIIGRKRGSPAPDAETSITNAEYFRAKEAGLVINTFVLEEVLTGRKIYRENSCADMKSIVDDVRVFDFVDLVDQSMGDNWLWPFRVVSDIEKILRSQFSEYLYLFAQNFRSVGGKTLKLRETVVFANGQLATMETLGTEPRPLQPNAPARMEAKGPTVTPLIINRDGTFVWENFVTVGSMPDGNETPPEK